MHFPKGVDELPDKEFYAILTPKSVVVPGDERSRTNPGHGYPEHTVSGWEIEVFPNKLAWENEIKMLESNIHYRKIFKAVKITPAKITSTISIEVNIDT